MNFLIVTLTLNKFLSFDSGVCISFFFPRLGNSVLFLPTEKFLSSMICNWYSVNHAIPQDNQDQFQ